jgi:hypothetical protein
MVGCVTVQHLRILVQVVLVRHLQGAGPLDSLVVPVG